MWVFSRYGFFSAVQALQNGGRSNRPDPDRVVVRARAKRHLINLADRFGAFSPKDITRNEDSDYRYRVVLPRPVWVGIVMKLAEDIDYDNFKSACKHDLPDDHQYHDALNRIWGVGYEMQATDRPLPAAEQRWAKPKPRSKE